MGDVEFVVQKTRFLARLLSQVPNNLFCHCLALTKSDHGWNLDKVKTTKLRDLTDSHWLKKSLMVFERVAHLYIEKENADEIQNG